MNDEDYNIIDSRFPWILRQRELSKENIFEISIEMIRYLIIYKNVDDIIVLFYKEYMKRKNIENDELIKFIDESVKPFIYYARRIYVGETSLELPKDDKPEKKRFWCF
jgi:hypothetical protein